MEIDKLKSFYKNKKVFITGCTGFKGSWLAMLLLNFGASIVGYSLDVPKDYLFYILNLDKKIQNHIGDIRNLENLKNVITDYSPDIVFHLAAQPLVIDSYEQPVYTYEVNVMGTVNICESLRSITNKKVSFINITTDKVYFNIEKDYLYKETDYLNGHDPYSNSKSCSELVTSSYTKSFYKNSNIVCSTCRSGNVIGGGDFSNNRIIPDIYRAIKNNSNIALRYPNSVRPYQHVLEPLICYLYLAMEQYLNSQVAGSYNIGPSKNDCIKTINLTEKFIELWDTEVKIKSTSNKFHEANLLMLDNTKISKTLNWSPTFSIDEAIQYTVEWYKELIYNSKNIIEFTQTQINEFLKKVK